MEGWGKRINVFQIRLIRLASFGITMYLIKFTVIFEESTRALIPLVPSKDFFAVFPHKNFFFFSFLLFACITLFLSQKKRNGLRHEKLRLASQSQEPRDRLMWPSLTSLALPCLDPVSAVKPPHRPISLQAGGLAPGDAQQSPSSVSRAVWGGRTQPYKHHIQAQKVPTGSVRKPPVRKIWSQVQENIKDMVSVGTRGTVCTALI